jgi:translation initiation factor 3 subunit E
MSAMLNLEKSTGEKWIVNLIRNARLDAKIDAQTNTVVMGAPQQSVYQQVIERTKAVGFRSTMLVASLEKRKAELLARQHQSALQVE